MLKEKEELCIELGKRICIDYYNSETISGERALAERYMCSRASIRASLAFLRKEKILHSYPRKGHVLDINRIKKFKLDVRGKTFNIVMVVNHRMLDNPATEDMIAGVIHGASKDNVNLIITKIDEKDINETFYNLDCLHPEVNASAYIVVHCFSPKLHQFLKKKMCPCVIFGETIEMREYKPSRYLQVGLRQYEKHQFAINKFLDLGHRKILIAGGKLCMAQKAAEDCLLVNKITDGHLDFIDLDYSTHPLIPSEKFAEKVCDSIDGHTALLVAFGGATALNIWKVLQERGIDIPGKLSLMIDCFRNDYFIKTYNISSIASSAWQEGRVCIEEVLSQLEHNTLKFGQRATEYSYTEGNTMAEVYK
jgi:DNA-binding LacI/PurR family transcriptional regulator